MRTRALNRSVFKLTNRRPSVGEEDVLTVILQDPQCSALELKSAQAPEQHAGTLPVQGEAVQLPQRDRLDPKSVQTPEQHAGMLPVHGTAVQLPQ